MRISDFIQTPFISHSDENMIYVSVADWDYCNPFKVEILVENKIVYNQKIFASKFSVMIPSYHKESICTVRITPFEDLPIESDFILKPQKQWQISLIYSSHEDLGYCGYIDKLHYECYECLKKAIELCQKNDGFKYMIEHYWWLDAFDFYATDGEKQQLKRLIESKRMELNAIHSGVHTSWANSEQLVREMYFSCFDAKRKYSITPKCAIYADISGVSWSAINAHTSMGIKYMAALANDFRAGKENEDFHPIFWWEDKSGENKVLFWYQRSYRANGLNGIWCDTKRQYPEGEFCFDNTKAIKTEEWFTKKLNKLADVDYNVLPLSFYDDREEPTTMLLTVCDAMNKKWKFPEFNMEIPSVVMSKIVESSGDTLPVFRGEITDQWADFATIAPNFMSKKRNIMRKLYDAELLSTISAINNKTSYKSKTFTNVVDSLCKFDEHCWATSSKHPQKMHRANIESVKKQPIDVAYSELEDVTSELIKQPTNDSICVVNTIPQKRSSYIRTNTKTPVPSMVPHQILPDESVITGAIEFEGIESKVCDAVLPFSKSFKIETDCIETLHYKVKINKRTQTLVSIFDKTMGSELIDNKADFELGQFIYLYSDHKTKPESSYELPKKISLEVYEGEIAYIIEQTSYEEQSGAEIRTQFIFYKYERNIDVDLSYKNGVGLLGDFYDRYKKNFFFAFPFNLNSPNFYTELQVGEKNEKTDILPINPNDFTITNNWVAAEEQDHGIAIYTQDMPVFHIGKIKYNRFEKGFDESKAHYYLYASSNRSNNLIYTSLEDCNAKYSLSILPYSGKHSSIVPQWSNSKEHNLLICKSDSVNIGNIKIDKENIRLISLKKAEDSNNAIIMRFIETENKATDCCITLFFTPKKAVYTTNDERDISNSEITNNIVHFKCKPYSYITLKLYGEFDIKES